jgi:hypothetical protein
MSYQDELKSATQTVIITPTSLIMEKAGETFRGMYLGIKVINMPKEGGNGEIKEVPTAYFYDGEKVLFNMGSQLTREIKNLPAGMSVEIKLMELKQNKHGGGKTKIYSVAPLNIPVKNITEIFGGILQFEAPAPQRLLDGAVMGEKKSHDDIMSELGYGPIPDSQVLRDFPAFRDENPDPAQDEMPF